MLRVALTAVPIADGRDCRAGVYGLASRMGRTNIGLTDGAG
jgi:hypothetical protein